MTERDQKGFVASFNRLRLALRHNFGKDEKELADRRRVYFDSLSGHSLGAVLAAERDFRVTGTSDAWFPSTVEWGDAAAEWEVHFAEQAVERHRQLPPAAVVVAEDLARVRSARAAVLAQLRQEGHGGLAQLLETFPVRHPSEAVDLPHCTLCHDSGCVIVDGTKADCECVPENPKIRHRHALLARQTAIEARRRRARQLAPGREDLVSSR
jgi:hypothetical protein